MAIYSLIQFTTVTLLYSLAVNLGDFQVYIYTILYIIDVLFFTNKIKDKIICLLIFFFLLSYYY